MPRWAPSSLCLAASKAYFCNLQANMEWEEAMQAEVNALLASAYPPPQDPPSLYDRHPFEDWGDRRIGWRPPTDGARLNHPTSLIAVAQAAVQQGLFPDQVPSLLCVVPPNERLSSAQAQVKRVR